MRSLIAVIALVFCSNAFAAKYSDLTTDQREAVEVRLRAFVPKYRIALEIATYNLRGSIPKDTKATDVLAKVKLDKWVSVEALFEQITKNYSSGGSDVVFKNRGQQRLMDLQREIQQTEYLMWSIFRRPIEDARARDAFMDASMEIESLSPLKIRLTSLARTGCEFSVTETDTSCN
ncbi:MAG: hypothetical protein V4760_17650 [Bdellovibrionota bacterium]